jgi:hypothetical protein
MELAESQPFGPPGQKVVLVDTPGFDNTEKSDLDVLWDIASYLEKLLVVSISQYISDAASQIPARSTSLGLVLPTSNLR